MEKKWYKSKTMWTCVIAVVTAVGSYFMDQITLSTMIEYLFEALAFVFIRKGIK